MCARRSWLLDGLIACSLDGGVMGERRVWLWAGHIGGINPPARCAVSDLWNTWTAIQQNGLTGKDKAGKKSP